MSTAETPQVTTEKSAFRMSVSVSVRIQAKPERIWSLLTDASDFARWNSTVTSITGKIALGEKIVVKVPISPKRDFKLKVIEFVPDKKMVWADGFAPMFRGVRTYTLEAADDGSTGFEMTEVFSGMMLPMIAGSLPDFAPAFSTYAADLQREAQA